MPEISRQQKQYLARQKKEKNIILAARTLLFVLFMGLWEISSDLGWIDSFIFSSPSLIAETFLSMCRDQSLFAHIAVTLAETLVSFFFVVSWAWELPFFSGVLQRLPESWSLTL